MPSSDKQRLYVAVYSPKGEETSTGRPEIIHHWGLITCPKNEGNGEQSRRFHVREKIQWDRDRPPGWIYESMWSESDSAEEVNLVRFLVAKVKDMRRLEAILRRTPIRSEEEGWNSFMWVKEAVMSALEDKKALSTKDHVTWDKIEDPMGWICGSNGSMAQI